MLLQLRAENYAVIDHAEVEFGEGLNLLTGETGAGKSILIDALALLLGGKGSSDIVRHGAEKAVISCVFSATRGAIQILEANGIDTDQESDEILLRREILASGKGRVFINSQAATVTVLRALAPELALVHAQGETLGAFDQAQQRVLLDRFGGIALEAVSMAHQAWAESHGRLQKMTGDEQDRLRMADQWRFQSEEIAQACIASEDEDLRLEAEKRVLANAEKLYGAAMGAHDLLYEAEHSSETTLAQALRLVEELAKYEPRLRAAAEQLQSARAAVEDVNATVREFAENVQAGPERLEDIEDRLAALDRLKRKYGKTLSDVLAFGEESGRLLDEVENRDALLAELRAEEQFNSAQYCLAAEALTLARREAARRLEKAAEQQINSLAMRVRLAIEVTSSREENHWTAHGWDVVAYRIATNVGEPLKPLDEIVSGGEMSRVMLALKVTVEEMWTTAKGVGKKSSVSPRTLVFDEIDIGIGGRAAEAVGVKLKALSKTQQVVCITHLPQIAAFADQHFIIEKRETKGRTHTAIRLMQDEDRIREIARMLSGATLTETSLRHAENLLSGNR